MDHEDSTQKPEQESPAADLLRSLRKRLSQTEISRRTGIPQPTLSRWETGGVPDASDDTMRLVQLAAELEAANGSAKEAA